MRTALICMAVLVAFPWDAHADGNRLAYLDSFCDPYYVHRDFPRLTTPQWVGDSKVKAVVVLAIDDMRDTAKYEHYLRPILNRLKKIDGRAPVSIMTCSVTPHDPQVAKWLSEGITLEVHTVDHPCPLLRDGDFAKAKSTVDRCVDLLASIPANAPVAYRMPCCDSLNTPSPRFFTEIFNRRTAAGRFMSIDSSVFNVLTPRDPSLGPAIVGDAEKPRFRRYLPFKSFVNTIEDYPYPYVIGRLCWEFPCAVPSDWEAQNIQQPNNPRTVSDLQAVLDAAVIKQGVMNVVFHPHGWIRNQQMIEVIDHGVKKHGEKILFLNFREALQRLNKHMLGGQSLRSASGQDGGVRLLDLNSDGYMDVVIGNKSLRRTRVWSAKSQVWLDSNFPVELVRHDEAGAAVGQGGRFGVMQPTGQPCLILRNERTAGAWRFVGNTWKSDPALLRGLEVDGKPVFTSRQGVDQGVRLRDLDGDGQCEVLLANPRASAVFRWDSERRQWRRWRPGLPAGSTYVNMRGEDGGLRFVDVNGDGREDLLFSDDHRYSLHLFRDKPAGWLPVFSGQRRAQKEGQDSERQPVPLPPFVSGGQNFGAWFHSGHLWLQNETTNRLPDLVDRRSYAEMLKVGEPLGDRSPKNASK